MKEKCTKILDRELWLAQVGLSLVFNVQPISGAIVERKMHDVRV